MVRQEGGRRILSATLLPNHLGPPMSPCWNRTRSQGQREAQIEQQGAQMVTKGGPNGQKRVAEGFFCSHKAKG